MARSARLRSVDAVEAMQAALAKFHEDACAALEELQMQIRRAVEWVQVDRKEFWNREVHRDWDMVSEARVDLEKARTFKRVGDHQPTCYEEKKALQRAKRRLQIAQEKVEVVRRWSYAVDRAVNEYVGAVSPLQRWLESDYHRAVAALKGMARALDSYLTTRAPPQTDDGALPTADPQRETTAQRSGDAMSEDSGEKPVEPAEPEEGPTETNDSGNNNDEEPR
jgi:hypothetical protein